MPEWETPFELIPVGKGRVVCEGEEVAILSIGHIGNYVTEARQLLQTLDLSPAHYDMRFVKPLDKELLHTVFKKFNKIITLEDGAITGGFGSAVLEFMADNGYAAKVIRLGIPDVFIEHGEQIQLHKECGCDPEGIARAVQSLVGVVLK
jgi:1-deoxy-D-xylulose-5-phosphate synthase